MRTNDMIIIMPTNLPKKTLYDQYYYSWVIISHVKRACSVINRVCSTRRLPLSGVLELLYRKDSNVRDTQRAETLSTQNTIALWFQL